MPLCDVVMTEGLPASAPVDRLRAALSGAKSIVAFTGAGLSTEAGVPDFRSPDSPWRVNKPIPFEAFLSSSAARVEAWRRKFAMDDHYRGALPASGHRFLERLRREGRLAAIVTQNIDGLQQAAGTPAADIIEIHGNGTYATCLDCGQRLELADIRPVFEATEVDPRCGSCDGLVKSATISFGQAMPQAGMRAATELARNCDLFLVMGSSLVVYPAATLPLVAAQAGATLAIVNREPTDLDGLADILVHDEIAAVVSALSGSG